MASHEGSRKRVKISRSESKPSTSSMASTSIPGPSTKCNTANGSDCSHGQSLQALQSDIDAMRQIVTCKICHRLLYEPYSLACGHTYCYSCLSQWLVDSRKKTCPDCRAAVYQQPTPSYLVRELVLVFVSRNELLPDGETTEEHNQYVKEEAELVAKDRASTDERTGGLFKGCFKRGARGYHGPLHDPSDGVDRCPTCHWELEDGFCDQCDIVVDPREHVGFSDYDDDSLSDDDLDHELDAEDAAAVFGADGQDDYFDHESIPDDTVFGDAFSPEPGSGPYFGAPARTLGGGRSRSHGHGGRIQIDIRSSDDDESEEDDDEEDIPGFVVDDNNVEYETSDSGEDTDVPVSRNHARRAVVVIPDDDHHAEASAEPTSGSEDDSENEGPVVLGSQRRKERDQRARMQRQRITISSDDESSEDENEYESAVDESATFAEHGGFSPLESSTQDYPDSVRSGYDSDDVSTVHPMDDDDGYEGHMYHDGTEEEGDDGSDRYDSESGWAMNPDTPGVPRHRPSTSSHRLHNLGSRSNRHTDVFASAFQRDASPLSGHYRPHFSVREPYSMQATTRGRYHPPQASLSTHLANGNTGSSSRQFGMFRPQQENMPRPSNRPRPRNMTMPAHPFQLSNTLNTLNHRTAPSSRNYNQRSHQLRNNHRAASATSSHSSTTGGVNVRETDSNASGSTIRATSSGRRKRNLSISSDDSVEELRRPYAY